MPYRSHNFRVQFHRQPLPREPFAWRTSDSIEVTALNATGAQRLARSLLKIDQLPDADRWFLRECLQLEAVK
jgi:hypothetical protein